MSDKKKDEDDNGLAARREADDAAVEEASKDNKLVAGANADLEDSQGRTFGDTTSSNAGANTPGQHGRDGGTHDGKSNNPAPSEEAINKENEKTGDSKGEVEEEIKKLGEKDKDVKTL